MTRYGVAVHAINIGNFDYLTNTWVRIETLLSPDFVEMERHHAWPPRDMRGV
jgi:hypothetical protein